MSGAPGPWDLLRAVFSPVSDLGHAERSVLASLLQHGDGATGRGSRPSIRRLAACTGLHHATVIRAIRVLVAAGLVNRTQRTNGARAEYTVNVEQLLNRVSDATGRNGVPVLECERTVSPLRTLPFASETPTVPLPLSVPKRKRAPSTPGTNDAPFEAWWSLYRTRTGRGTEKAASWKAYGRLPAVDREALLDRTEAWFAARDRLRAAGAFVPEAPDPKRYLAKRRWTDEFDVPAVSASRRVPSADDLEALRLAREDDGEARR